MLPVVSVSVRSHDAFIADQLRVSCLVKGSHYRVDSSVSSECVLQGLKSVTISQIFRPPSVHASVISLAQRYYIHFFTVGRKYFRWATIFVVSYHLNTSAPMLTYLDKAHFSTQWIR